MLILSQSPGGVLSAHRRPTSALTPSWKPRRAHRFSKSRPSSPNRDSRKPPSLSLANASDGDRSSPSPSTFPADDEPVIVGGKDMPLEGVIQFDKPSSPSKLEIWGKVALLAGGDVLALLLFSAIGRFSHGFPVLDFDTIRTADPFLAGWFLSAYFLGGYNEDGRGDNGSTKATITAAKSWAVGIPLGVAIRTLTLGRIPPTGFIVVTMGSTAVLLIGWRTLLQRLLPSREKGDGDYRKGNPFELFELLASLVRRW